MTAPGDESPNSPSRDESPDSPSGKEYRVGKCRPPLGTRFRPGQSGNPRGRPKGARGVGAVVARELDEKVEAKENGRRRRITKLDAAVKQLVNRAANGDQRAAQLVFSLLGDHQSRPAPRAVEYTSEADALIVAELVRRLSPPTP